jgi:hypothetical protein
VTEKKKKSKWKQKKGGEKEEPQAREEAVHG